MVTMYLKKKKGKENKDVKGNHDNDDDQMKESTSSYSAIVQD